MTNPFFKNTGPYEINDLLKLTSIKNQSISNEKINDIKDLGSSKKDWFFIDINLSKSLIS